MKMMMTYQGSGVSPQVVGIMEDGNMRAINRNYVVSVWNAQAAKSTWNNHKRAITPFRAVNNAGDYLSRSNYTSGGSNQVYGAINRAGNASALRLAGGLNFSNDNTNIPSSTTNVKYVYDGSDYTRFKKMMATQKSYNDYSFGGSNNGSQVALAHARM